MKAIYLLCENLIEFGEFKQLMPQNIITPIFDPQDLVGLQADQVIHITNKATSRGNYFEILASMRTMLLKPAPASSHPTVKSAEKSMINYEAQLRMDCTWKALMHGIPAGEIAMNVNKFWEDGQYKIVVQPIRVGGTRDQ